ncbi:SPOR domain-containing protein [Thermodesulfobacteriota bacterium]
MAKKTKTKGKRYKIELTALSATLWGIFLFFLLTWIFVLGILVGRGFLPGTVTTISDLRGQIQKLQDMVGTKESYESISSRKEEPAPKLDFYKQLENKKEVVKNQLKSDSEPEPLKILLKTEKNTVLPETGPEEKIIPEPEPKPEPETAEQKPTPLLNKNNYTVQIASLGEKVKAESLISRLIENGFDAYYYEAVVNGKTYYRVRCGKFTTRKEAESYSLKLENEEGIKGFVSRLE